MPSTTITRVGELDYSSALNQLMTHAGIGEKVADCILLFSQGFYEAFPVDTWIKKGMQRLYFSDQPTSLKTIKAHGQDHFGAYAGYAQQYLFYWLREQKVR